MIDIEKGGSESSDRVWTTLFQKFNKISLALGRN